MIVQDIYHGQKIEPGHRARHVPPMPSGRHGDRPDVVLHGHSIAGLDPGDVRGIREAGRPDAGRRYSRVRLIGNYNLGCVDTQALEYHDITPEEAHHYAWAAFGACVHVIAYCDESEQLIAGE